MGQCAGNSGGIVRKRWTQTRDALMAAAPCIGFPIGQTGCREHRKNPTQEEAEQAPVTVIHCGGKSDTKRSDAGKKTQQKARMG